MRVFDNLPSAILEIRRDLAKSPTYVSSRVQNHVDGRLMHEAAPYLYSVRLGAIPTSPVDLVAIGKEHFPFWRQTSETVMTRWLSAELDARLWCAESIMAYADDQHPVLCQAFEGAHPSYSYNERMVGWREFVVASLMQPGSRRAFWPIFNHEDALRAPLKTRIPCTLGYQWVMRPVLGDHQDILDGMLLQRSCDFERFWLSDLWFTAELTRTLLAELESMMLDPPLPGVLSHFIASFHTFVEEEIF